MSNLIVHFFGYGMAACMREGPPSRWPEDHRWSADWKDVTCTDCLLGKDVIHTFTISPEGNSITCLRCKKTSFNLNDVKRRYCGFCHVFHEDIWPPARHWWIHKSLEELQLRAKPVSQGRGRHS